MPTQPPSLGLWSTTSRPDVEPARARPEDAVGDVACRCRQDRPSLSLTWRRWRRLRLQQLQHLVAEGEEEEEDVPEEAAEGEEDEVAAQYLPIDLCKNEECLIKIV